MKIEDAYKVIADTEKKELQAARAEIVAFRERFDGKPPKIEVSRRSVGPASAPHSLLTSFNQTIASWRSQLDSYVQQIDNHLASYEEPNGTGNNGPSALP